MIANDAIAASIESGDIARAITRTAGVFRALNHYREFMEIGDLVFDLGANVGEHTAVFRALGARVVAIDPQPACVRSLERRFEGDDQVTIVPEAVAASPATYPMRVGEHHAFSTMSPEWIRAVSASGRFGDLEWPETIEVRGTTLDSLIAEHGLPAFCKIDVEGFEAEVAAGLSRPLPAASFEFAGEALDGPLACIERFSALGPCEFALSAGETMAIGRWSPADEIASRLQGVAELAWGDVYVRSTES